ncbi:MAG: efflux RND transporter periplasmic adaptor subunit [Pseudomonadota bacterium]
MKTRILFFILFIVVSNTRLNAGPGAHGPDGQHIDEVAGNSNNSFGRQVDGSVKMPMPVQAALGIRTKLVAIETVTRTVELPGTIRPHPNGHALVQAGNNGHFYAPPSGIRLSGTSVNKGQVLGEMRYSDTAFEQASQNSELRAVRNNIAQTQRDVTRLQELGELASKQELERLETRLKTLREQEQSLSVGIEKPVKLIAPMSGIVVNNKMVNGMWVQAGQVLFEIVASDQRHIDVYTSDYSLPKRVNNGVIDQVSLKYHGYSPVLESGLLALHFETSDDALSQAVLPINQAVTVMANLNEEMSGIVIAANAIVKNSQNLPIVWIKAGAERFVPQIVQYQQLDSNYVVITNGLGTDNRVVVQSTSLLNQVR